MTISIVTDSLADLPQQLADTLEIAVVPLSVNFGMESYRTGLDITSAEFYVRLVTAKTLPTTSQPSVGQFTKTYSAIANRGHDIVSIHASSKLSGTFNAALQAAKEILGARVKVIDTSSASLAEGLVVTAAARTAQAGGSFDEVVAAAQDAVSKTDVYFVLDNLEYLQKGGRIGKASAFIGGLLSIKPVLTLRNGEVHPHERVRTHAKALARLKEIVQASAPYAEAAVLSGTIPDQILVETVRPLAPDLPLITGVVGPAIGTYTGPGVLGVAFRRH
jgi:DegV family protein with EDD domain